MSVLVLNHDNWDERELVEGDAYAVTCYKTFDHIIEQLAKVEIPLSDDKRAVVELSVLLEAAARLAHDRLHINADDFASAARDVLKHVR